MNRLPRSYLFVPGDRPDRLAKAPATAAAYWPRPPLPAVQLAGRMVDKPVIERARRIADRAC